jgi:hypothetical protein
MKRPNAKELGNSVFQGPIVYVGNAEVTAVDQDELQLMDELNKVWNRTWCREVAKKRTRSIERRNTT